MCVVKSVGSRIRDAEREALRPRLWCKNFCFTLYVIVAHRPPQLENPLPKLPLKAGMFYIWLLLRNSQWKINFYRICLLKHAIIVLYKLKSTPLAISHYNCITNRSYLQCPLELAFTNVLKLLGKTGRNLAEWCLFCLTGNLIRQDIADALPVLPCVCIRTETRRVVIEDFNGPSTLGQVASCVN